MLNRISKRGFSALFFLLIILSGCQSTNSPAPASTQKSQLTQLGQAKTILIKDAALVVSMDPDLGEGNLGLLKDADILLKGDRITKIGKGIQAPDAFVLDARGKIVMPGFVDVHNHLWQSVIRGCGADQELISWLEQCVFPLSEAQITGREAYAAAKLSTADLINTGVTTVVDDSHSYNPEFVEGNIQALNESGLRFVYAYCGSKDSFAHMEQIKTEVIDPNPKASFQVCAHPALALLEWLKDTSQQAKKMQVPLNLHLLESQKQLADKPMRAMELAGSFDGKLLLNHVIHLTDSEIAKLAKHDARVAYNPVSNMRLASGIFRFAEMKEAGVKVGLGLDGGTNDTSDFFATMKAAIGLQRAKTLNPKASPTVEEVLRMATLGGAEVLDMEDRIGSLTPGKSADLLILNPQKVHFAPLWDWLSQVVLNGRPSDVEYVFASGKALKVEGEVLNMSEAELVEEAQIISDRLRKFLYSPDRQKH